ncbi:hypothetical protein GALMADRAFT_718781 [Galerina marginata CBS 339.88]|uniref:Uncharacterized protein n=1 Tax=Galerina marginata (strain CBS 339.88) TaxID=685588 RepID=A0A067TZW1_GALM3|nr:hypothetical protein GALMADRAFT_718781 [Galerina marginata CBS 339.88]
MVGPCRRWENGRVLRAVADLDQYRERVLGPTGDGSYTHCHVRPQSSFSVRLRLNLVRPQPICPGDEATPSAMFRRSAFVIDFGGLDRPCQKSPDLLLLSVRSATEFLLLYLMSFSLPLRQLYDWTKKTKRNRAISSSYELIFAPRKGSIRCFADVAFKFKIQPRTRYSYAYVIHHQFSSCRSNVALRRPRRH